MTSKCQTCAPHSVWIVPSVMHLLCQNFKAHFSNRKISFASYELWVIYQKSYKEILFHDRNTSLSFPLLQSPTHNPMPCELGVNLFNFPFCVNFCNPKMAGKLFVATQGFCLGIAGGGQDTNSSELFLSLEVIVLMPSRLTEDLSGFCSSDPEFFKT